MKVAQGYRHWTSKNNGEILPPGNIGAVLVDQPFMPDCGKLYPTTVEKSSHCPLSYFFGHTSIDKQPDLYKFYIKELAKRLIINSCGYVVKSGLDMIKFAIESFEVDLIVVIDNELLYSQLNQHFGSKLYSVLLPKSGGAVMNPRETRKKLRLKRMTSYFYGTVKELYPHNFSIGFDQIKIFKIGCNCNS
ncbi:hypothetical protein MXB_3111 [Myxobolus squamalis]|nr:hypothetical protein MXB_3111 [Myxobolus squamalis]